MSARRLDARWWADHPLACAIDLHLAAIHRAEIRLAVGLVPDEPLAETLAASARLLADAALEIRVLDAWQLNH